jgi:hypothetical protein
MDITVYLPDELGERAKNEGLNFSRMLRAAVNSELEQRDAMNDALSDELQTYEVEIPYLDEATGETVPVIGRVTGRQLFEDDAVAVWLKPDMQILILWKAAGWEVQKPDSAQDAARSLGEYFLASGEPTTFIELCRKLGVKPVIDL